jgi:hypothetical protein
MGDVALDMGGYPRYRRYGGYRGDALHDGGVAGLQDRGVFPDLLVEDVQALRHAPGPPAVCVSSCAAEPRSRRRLNQVPG